MKIDIILIGGGGHCKSVIDVIESTGEYNILGILDKEDLIGKDISGYEIIGTDHEIEEYVKKGVAFTITIGQIKSAHLRIALFNLIKEKGGEIPSIVANTAYVSKKAVLGEGTVVMHKAFVNSNVKVGVNNIINTRSTLEHDTMVGDHCHISTHVVVNGEVKIGNEVFIGSNSTISNQVKIGAKSIVGIGSVVVSNIPENVITFGIPAKIKSRR